VFDDFNRVSTENRILRRDLKSRVFLNERLRAESISRQQEVNGCLCLSRMRSAMQSAKRMHAGTDINFPKEAFTIEELEEANSAVCRGDVIMHLAYLVSRHQVEFIPQGECYERALSGSVKGKTVSFIYRVITEYRPGLRTASHQNDNGRQI